MEVFKLLVNLLYMVKTIIPTGYFCLLIPSAGQNTDWWEADSFQKKKSAICVKHSINFSWPNSKKCNQSASGFSLCAEISSVLRDEVGWEQMSKELSLDGKTTDWWKVTESFVQSAQDHRGVLYNCHSVRGFCINCTAHTHTQTRGQGCS